MYYYYYYYTTNNLGDIVITIYENKMHTMYIASNTKICVM